jgi:broad specificity phosphatase PhoE
MSRLFVIRHGQASFGAKSYDRLSNLGREQARITGEWLTRQGIRFDAAFAGTMARQTDTARLCLEAMPGQEGLALIQDAGFNEYPTDEIVGGLMGPVVAERPELEALVPIMTTDRKAFQTLFEAIMTAWVGGVGETNGVPPFRNFQTRVHAGAYRLMATEGRGKTTALFTSGGPISLLMQLALGLDDQMAIRLNWQVRNASISLFFFTPDRLTLAAFNQVGHLETLNRSELITYR